ncbi:MAG: CheR family methyltransferase [Alphaproteobacteria bacterium]|jgi:chemotaxis protein methyltransferase CheR
MSHIQPVRIRPTDGDLIGTTAFFRNRAFLFHFGEEIAKLSTPGRPVEIFVHACSIGAEVYSLAIYLQTVHPTVDFRITSTDISGGFVEYARAAEYPGQAVEALTEQERSC